MPQGPSAGLTAGWEVVESEDKLVALVADVGGPVTIRRGLHNNLRFTFYLTLVGVQDLGQEKTGNFKNVISETDNLRNEGSEKCLCTLPGISLGFLWDLPGTHQYE